MNTETKTTRHSDSGKKPYQAPKLVVLGGAAEITRNTFGPFIDGTFPSEATGS